MLKKNILYWNFKFLLTYYNVFTWNLSNAKITLTSFDFSICAPLLRCDINEAFVLNSKLHVVQFIICFLRLGEFVFPVWNGILHRLSKRWAGFRSVEWVFEAWRGLSKRVAGFRSVEWVFEAWRKLSKRGEGFRSVERVSEAWSGLSKRRACFRSVERASEASSVLSKRGACFRSVERASEASSGLSKRGAGFRSE